MSDITNYEKACQMVGQGAADTLAKAGLLVVKADPVPQQPSDPKFAGATPTHDRQHRGEACSARRSGGAGRQHSMSWVRQWLTLRTVFSVMFLMVWASCLWAAVHFRFDAAWSCVVWLYIVHSILKGDRLERLTARFK